MAKHVLIGGAGAPNYGDELIVRGWVDFLTTHIDPKTKILIYENIAKNEIELHGPFAKNANIEFRDDLAAIAKANKELSFWGQVARGYEFIQKNGMNSYKKHNLKELQNAETVHLHGGGYLNKLFPVKGFFLGLCAALNKAYGTRIFATGIGFGPADPVPAGLETTISEIFSRFEIFELRDVDNYRKLSKQFPFANFSYGLDDCFLVPQEKLRRPDDGKRRLYLSLLTYNMQKLASSYWDALAKVSEEFDEVVFLESCPWADKKVIEFVGQRFPKMKVVPVDELLNSGVVVGDHDFAFVSRFHVHFVLARLGCVGTFAKDNEYYNVKHQSILDRGSRFREFDGKKGTLYNADGNFRFKSGSDFQQMALDNDYHNRKIALAKNLYRM
ncbi:polysaccharide pyruvyl transferase family protein [Rhizobium sp. G21]|uniref:polysaccharide pyruvyl transferase family protein n=1 Tax=Rhizobium sp. G21 TaxID=2758439 RepID=UPI001600A816|nr:polysaccharide pyruvyl transferase family protein [Rhizobium sp. G21]MBB1250855.1 polysaccharide pyruvyl transferase family protein [Rhizobium sp. G21]